jgi:sarcosine oxidase
MNRCEGLNIGKAGSDYIADIIDSLDTVQRPYELLRPGSRRLVDFGIQLLPDEEAVLELDAGVIVPQAALAALSQEVRQAGGQLIEGVTVRTIVPCSAGLRLETDGDAFTADRVIVAIGPWVHDLVSSLPVQLTVTVQQQLMLASDRPVGDGRQFVWAEVVDDDGYGVVNLAPQRHFVGSHAPGPVGTPSTSAEREPGRALLEQVAAFRARLSGGIEIKQLDVRVCSYTNTVADDFVVSPSADLPGVILLSACSGHGFKFAPTNGHRAAELAAA